MTIFDLPVEEARSYVKSLGLAPDSPAPQELDPASLGYAPPAPSFPPQGEPDSEDEYLRQKYHTVPRVVEADDTRLSFQVNNHWIKPIALHHEVLVRLFQMFYDVASLIERGRMSPSVLNVITNKIIVDTDTYSYIDQDYYNLFRGRHFASLYGEQTINEKCDWTRTQLWTLRKQHIHLLNWTTAKEVEAIGKGFKLALHRPDVEKRATALGRMKDWIHIDTRSKAGYPTNWCGMPVLPAQNAKAKFVRPPGEERWTLQIDRGGVRPSVLQHLRPEHLIPPIRSASFDEIPWWCESPELRHHFLN